jgi:hypothetical protein
MQVRKKPVVVKAEQYIPEKFQELSNEFMEQLVITPGEKGVDYGCGFMGKMVQISTLEGMMKVSPGDWIIKGVKGEFYPCKPDIFEKTYDFVIPDQPVDPKVDCVAKTKAHKDEVSKNIGKVLIDLAIRARVHDDSKLEEPEFSVFAEYTPKLAGSTYGSPEYKQFLVEMGKALKHHYLVNKHHPEYWTDGVKGMSLVDIIEMLCDWLAATKRHNDGDILKSIEINQKRFGYGDELKQILLNTVGLFEESSKKVG